MKPSIRPVQVLGFVVSPKGGTTLKQDMNISPDDARHVLHFLGHPGGCEAGSFTTALMGAYTAAGLTDKERLRAIYPDLAAAYELASTGSEGVETLQRFARTH